MKRYVLIAAMAACVVATGTAVAFFNTTGAGSATVAVATAKPLTTLTASGVTASLYPGATGSLTVQVNNTNPYNVRVTDVTAGSGSITSDKGAACNTSTGVTFVPQNGLALDVPANGSATFTLPGAVQMSNTSDNTCQGATFTIPVALSGVSQ